MLNFSALVSLNEAAEPEGKLTHLKHAEEGVADGHSAYKHAVDTLHAVHNKLKGKNVPGLSMSTKFDGSPSVVFGHHPETGKFFVATKSAFNVNPKINYSHEDIEKNHGHAPGLVSKLKQAFTNLQKVAPRKGVYQGDFMYSHHELHHHSNGDISSTPNTLTYTAHKDTDTGKKMQRAKMGFVVHTKYHGSNFSGMTAAPHTDTSEFKNHPDVHLMSAETPADTRISRKDSEAFTQHMNAAKELHDKQPHDFHDAVQKHSSFFKSYINKTIKSGETPTVKGLRAHIAGIHQKAIDSVKTEKSKAQKRAAMQADLDHHDMNAHHFDTALKLHDHIQKAKNVLVSAMDKGSELRTSLNGTPSAGEGHVVTHQGKSIKLVNRSEFSRANFAKQR